MDNLVRTINSVSLYSFQRCISNCQKHVPDLLKEISVWMTNTDVRPDMVMDVQIVLAEAVNNVIEHGFKDENSGEIHIDIEVIDKGVVVQLMDNGTEFILSSKPVSPVINKAAIDDLPEGGFGWFLINEITHSFELRRSNNKNKLTLNFH